MINLIKRRFKFGLVGVICFIIDYSLMLLLTEVANASYLLSCGVSLSVSVVVMAYYFVTRKIFLENKENY